VQNIHLEGGSVLGTSRGGGDVKRIVDSIVARGINALFVLGGNGTHAGADAIFNECKRRNYDCAVVGVPKTIDNDILHVRHARTLCLCLRCVLACVCMCTHLLMLKHSPTHVRSVCRFAFSSDTCNATARQDVRL
jgi:hypothetical protein